MIQTNPCHIDPVFDLQAARRVVYWNTSICAIVILMSGSFFRSLLPDRIYQLVGATLAFFAVLAFVIRRNREEYIGHAKARIRGIITTLLMWISSALTTFLLGLLSKIYSFSLRFDPNVFLESLSFGCFFSGVSAFVYFVDKPLMDNAEMRKAVSLVKKGIRQIRQNEIMKRYEATAIQHALNEIVDLQKKMNELKSFHEWKDRESLRCMEDVADRVKKAFCEVISCGNSYSSQKKWERIFGSSQYRSKEESELRKAISAIRTIEA